MTISFLLEVENAENQYKPTWEDVFHAIKILDGENHSIVNLTTNDERGLLIGGGNEGQFIIAYFPDFGEQTTLFLSEPKKGDEKVEIIVQSPSTYPKKWVTDFAHVQLIMRHFYNTGQIPIDYFWEEG
jgi:hypothetical protein